MKAVILAGGEGTRLRPLTVNVPKPMTRLAGRPVLDYILRLLARQNIREIAITTAYLPQTIENYFGDGAEWGVQLRYFRETVPKGTAGSVAQCADFLGNEDFLVISGDCVCDFDFSPCLELHRHRNASATLALYHSTVPLEYGLAVTDADGRVERFVEKPAWEQVCTDTVNTGIYILSPRILEMIPRDKPFDFAGDLFPLLLKEKSLYAAALEGYWCDIGDCGAFLRCNRDLLEARVRADRMGLKTFSDICGEFPDAEIRVPCKIDKDVRILAGAVVGSHTVLECGTMVGECAEVSDSVCGGCVIGDGAVITGAIIGRGAVIGAHARLHTGCVIGDGARVGAYAEIASGVSLWPDQEVPEGMRVAETQAQSTCIRSLTIGQDGRMTGELTLENGTSLGLALAQLAENGTVALGCTDSPAADAFLTAVEAGLRTCGASVLRHDAPIEAVARFAQRLCKANWGLFVTEMPDKTLCAALTGEDGRVPAWKILRKVEGAARRRERIHRNPPFPTRTQTLTGCRELFLANVATECDCSGMRVSVIGKNSAADILSALFTRRGAEVVSGAYLAWKPSEDGLRVEAIDEHGNPQNAFATEEIWKQITGKAPENDGLTLALQLTAWLKAEKQTLAAIAETLPVCVTASCDVDICHERAEIMRKLSEKMGGNTDYSCKNGHVCVHPRADRRALRIIAQGTAAETAEELCGWMEQNVRQADAPETENTNTTDTFL